MSKSRPKGEGMVRKRTDGRWEGRIVIGHKDNGKPIYKTVLARTQKDLLNKLHQMIELYKDADLSNNTITLGEWLDKWINEYMMFRVRERTLDIYKNLIKNQVKPFIGNKKLSSLSCADIQKFYNTVKKEGRVKKSTTNGHELSDSMVRRIHMMLHEALDYAVNQNMLVSNPTNNTIIPKNNYKQKQILNNEQLDRFMDIIKSDKLWYDFFYTEITTGLRRGEICGLKWSDLDESTGRLIIRRTISYKNGNLKIGETKTDRGTRNILLPSSTFNLLVNRKETAYGEWIFPNFCYPEKPINPQTAYIKLKDLLKKADLPDIRFHDLRHTFATHALASGVDAKTLSGILGHTNASFTLDTYTHITTDMQKQASDIVEGFMNDFIM